MPNVPKRASKSHTYNDAKARENKDLKQVRHEKRMAKMKIKAAERKERKKLEKIK